MGQRGEGACFRYNMVLDIKIMIFIMIITIFKFLHRVKRLYVQDAQHYWHGSQLQVLMVLVSVYIMIYRNMSNTCIW